MALKLIDVVDVFSYLEDVKSELSLAFDISAVTVVGSSGVWPKYLENVDQYMILVNTSSGQRLLQLDPLLQDASTARIAPSTNQTPPIASGVFNRNTGEQVHYSYDGAQGLNAGDLFRDYDEITVTKSSVNSFRTGGVRVDLNSGSPASAGDYLVSAAGDLPLSHWLIFEDLTDGITGETVATGANVYPQGLGLVRCDEAVVGAPIDSGSAGGSDNALIWIDLDTQTAVGRLNNTTGRVGGTGAFNEQSIAAQSFGWLVQQLIQDTDSTPAAPKGELLLISAAPNIPADPVSFTESIFVKIIDFNPLGVTATGGAPTRTHEQVRLLSVINFNDSPIFDQGSGFNFAEAQYSLGGLFFHPSSRRFILFAGDSTATSTGTNGTNLGYIASWERAVDPSVVLPPVPTGFPRTNDVVEYGSSVLGDLGEQVSGVDVTWTLERVSTIQEELTGAFTPASTSTVANPPIDQAFPTATEGTLVVQRDDAGVLTTLAETTDYTVVLATGVITWVTDQSGADRVLASYEHRETPATPAHGTLLSPSSRSNSTGRVFTQIQYADDDTLVGELDLLTVVVA